MMHKALVLLKKIPAGKVVTYGDVASACNTSPRAVGAIMRSNQLPQRYPCYKVVRSSGEVGGYGGRARSAKKIRLLRRDGVRVTNGRIDLKKFRHSF